jgi:membrane-bound metal-dependent hydrolase YbcI (DUF457 family)
MPSPVGHALGGLLVGLALAPPGTASAGASGSTRRREFIALCVAAACVPDIDFAWGRHNMETHSVGFALLLALLVLAWRRSARPSIACALAVGTHVLFDWMGSDDFAPLGVMALWPVSREFYFADAYVFATISRRYWLPGFVQHNVMPVLREIVILLPLVGLLWWIRRRAAPSGQDDRPLANG